MINILNKHQVTSDQKNTYYIGRGSPLGNPYYFGSSKFSAEGFLVDNREEAIEKYIFHIKRQIKENNFKIISALNDLIDKNLRGEEINLVCFCAPKPCHGRVIKEIVESRNSKF